ncbi:tyrosine-type recombinase/integrase [Pseudomonas sp. MONT-RG-20F-R14-05]|uniref:tyrosine-type recombinase/integrase n=1 Tax=unclassified Pseudomonas TaxID=196821 RepID=UPI003221EB1F
MDKAHNLQLRGGTYHVRFDVPADVRKAFGGRRVMSKSLKTGSLTEAMHRRSQYLLAWWERVDAARDGVPLAEGWQDGVLETITALDGMMQDQKRGLIGEKVPQVEIDPAVEARMRSNPRFVAAFEAWVRDHLQDGMDGKVRLFDELGQGIQSLIPAALTRSQNIPAGQLQELKALIADPSTHRSKSPITSAALEAFRAFRTKHGVSSANIATQHKRLMHLSAYLAETGKALDFDCVAAWIDSLGLAGKTQQQYLLAGNAFWRWAMKYDPRWRETFKGAVSPFERHAVALPRGKAALDAKRKEFTLPDMNRLYAAAQEAGNVPLADLIKLGYYTGMRISELCSLRTGNVVNVDGVEMLDVTDSKTPAGIRCVPIHPAISSLVIRLVEDSRDGFLVVTDFVGRQGDRTGAIGKAFGALKTSLGYGGQHVFHSIRGTTITQLARHDVPYPMICELVGHKTKTVTFDVYSAGFSAQQKLTAISTVPRLRTDC